MVASVTTEAALVDLALRGAVERQTHVLEVDDCVDRFFCENLCGILINEVVATLNRVKGVPLPVVLLDVGERRCHAALSRAGVRTRRVELGDNSGLGLGSRLDRGAHTRAACSDDDNVELVIGCLLYTSVMRQA